MKLFLVRPHIDPATGAVYEPWNPWYDKSFGHVVRAESERAARILAGTKAGDEGDGAWLDERLASCVELTPDGDAGVVITDFHAA